MIESVIIEFLVFVCLDFGLRFCNVHMGVNIARAATNGMVMTFWSHCK